MTDVRVGWMDGRMDGWMEGWIDGWMDGKELNGKIGRSTHRQIQFLHDLATIDIL